MSQIIQLPTPYDIQRQVKGHNEQVLTVWATRGNSSCQPFQKSPVPAAADLSRIPAAERGGVQEVRV